MIAKSKTPSISVVMQFSVFIEELQSTIVSFLEKKDTNLKSNIVCIQGCTKLYTHAFANDLLGNVCSLRMIQSMLQYREEGCFVECKLTI